MTMVYTTQPPSDSRENWRVGLGIVTRNCYHICSPV